MEPFTYLVLIIQSIILFVLANPRLQLTALDITTDTHALIVLKSQLSAEFIDPLSTWDSSSPCHWTGVTCDQNGQRVVGLDLSGLRLRGVISPSIGNLSFLRQLELQDNQLTGQLPDELGNLFRLQMLNLSFNSFEGIIPSNISQCRQLRIFDLKQNQVSGIIPEEISYLTQLQVLNLASNEISGNIPPSLANISTLSDLNLATNRLDGSIPPGLSRLSLRSLELSMNYLSGAVPPSLYNSSSLVFLGFAVNNLTGELPGNIALTVPNLSSFNFCFNIFTGTIPWSLHNLTNLRITRMSHNYLRGTIPPGIGNLQSLEMYNIGFNRIEGNLDFLQFLTNSTRLATLAIDSNLLEGEIPISIGNLSLVLTKLYMGWNNIYGTIPSSIGHLQSLNLLDMRSNDISGVIPQEIGQLRELRVLSLANNLLYGRIPDSLNNLELVTRIDLSENELTGHIPETFGNFQNLISLDLSHNQLNGSIPTQILNLPTLNAFLNLSQNQLTGPLPDEIHLLEKAVVINISDNRLSGVIPSSISECRSLEQLLLARNAFFGQIPDALGLVRGLETLDLSSNNLSGTIPLDLQNLQSLQLLNLSFNHLEGEIPRGGIFRNPSRVHLESNQLLYQNIIYHIRGTPGRQKKIMCSIISLSILISFSFTLSLIYYIRKRKQTAKGSEKYSNGHHQMVSYEELRVGTNTFNEGNLIGHGSFGFVYCGVLQGETVAVKVINSMISTSRKSFSAECAALRHVRHRNLVKLITVCSSIDSKNEEFLALIFEFMVNGSLHDWLNGMKRYPNGMGLSFVDRLSLTIGIASAIDYLHNGTEVAVVHCDLKPSNVLLDSDMNAKISDFGLAKILLQGSNHDLSVSSTHSLRGSIGYIPPEYGYGVKPSTAGDVYSFGILLLELFTGKSPTKEIFSGDFSLRSWVQNEFPSNLKQVLDSDLLLQERSNNKAAKNNDEMDSLITIFDVGLSCTADSPDSRIGIKEALHKLKSVETFLVLGKPIAR